MVRIGFVLGIAFAPFLRAQSTWFRPVLAVEPSARDTHELASEPASGHVVLFGGVLATNAGQLADVWEWTGNGWTQGTPSAVPAARESHVLAADGSGGVVLFGGYSFQSGLLNDTWRYAQGQWQRLQPLNSPSPRRYHAGATTGNSILVFGGGNASTSVAYGDTWEWTGGDWAQRFPQSAPPARLEHELAYDTVRQRVVLFGGRNGTSRMDDTWEWLGADWLARAPANRPPARGNSYMAFDASTNRTVVYGGFGGPGLLLSDCWSWDGVDWAPIALSGPGPGPRNAPIAYSPRSGSLLLFGGHGVGAAMGDTWLMRPSVPATFANHGTGCSGSAGVPSLTASTGSLPVLGSTFRMTLASLPAVATVAIGVVGFGDTVNQSPLGNYPLPRDWSPIGMSGCTQWISDDGTGFLLALGGSVEWPLAVPSHAGLSGLPFFVQAFVGDPLANPFGGSLSNSARGTLGI